jgi:hypothetical protein
MLDTMQAQLEPLIRGAAEQPLEIYLEWGTYDLRNPHEAWDMAQANRALAETLRARGYRVSGGEVADANRTDLVFESLFPLRAAGGG